MSKNLIVYSGIVFCFHAIDTGDNFLVPTKSRAHLHPEPIAGALEYTVSVEMGSF